MKPIRIGGLLLCFIVALLFPLVFSNPAVTTLAIFMVLFAAGAVGWNLFSGYTGYISLGYAVFFGVGAYTLALLCQYWNVQDGSIPFVLLPLAGLAAVLFAIPLGWIALRVRRHTFVVVTIAMMFTFQLLAYNLQGLTHGSGGLTFPLPSWGPDFFNLPFYYVSLVILVLAFAISWWIRSSKYGLGLLAIRDDEDRALGLGVRTGAYKLAAFAIAAFFAGLVGGMIVYFNGAVFPAVAFNPTFDVAVAAMSLAGGIGTLSGPLIGGLLLEFFQQVVILQVGSIPGLDLLTFGLLLLIFILVLPEGIVPSLQRLWLKRKAARALVKHVVHPEVQKGEPVARYREAPGDWA